MVLIESKRSSVLVQLAKRSISVLNCVSTARFCDRTPINQTHLKVSFSSFQARISMGTFDSTGTGFRDISTVPGVSFGKRKQGLNCLLV